MRYRATFLTAPLVLLGLLASLPRHAAGQDALTPERGRLESHVYTLCSPEFAGRRGAGADRAARYILEHFRRLGLEPLFGDSHIQRIPGSGADGEAPVTIGANIGARIPARGPKKDDRVLLLTAHYDHLGVRNGKLYPGADDNASGVAMLLEVARCLATSTTPIGRDVLFVAFDLEEDGLVGSRYFVDHSPIAMEDIGLFITADMLGRSLGGICKDDVFVMGSEFSPAIRPAIRDATGDRDLRVHIIGSDLLFFDRSDYGPFRAKKVPHLFFSTGENPTYHTPSDVPETLDYPKLERVSGLIHNLVQQVANRPELPAWDPSDTPSLDEARALRDVMATLLEHRDQFTIPPLQARLLTNTVASLERILESGEYSPAQRSVVLRVAQLIVVSVL